jgi:hypothetical protein
MVERQLPPRFAVRYVDALPSELAMPPAADERNAVPLPHVIHEREATSLAGARSIQRALLRRGHRVYGIYERINLRVRPVLAEADAKYPVLVCGKLAWDWDGERQVNM